MNAWKNPKLQFIRANVWQITEEYSYVTDTGHLITVHEGFESDGVSSPRALWPFIPATGDAFPAGIIHDYLYSNHSHGLSRRDCDRVLWEACARLGIDRLYRDLIYDAVRIGGGGRWE